MKCSQQLSFAVAALTAAAQLGAHDPAPGGDKAGVVIQCAARAEVRGAQILLRDLGEIETKDTALAERLLEISFGRRPAPGFSRVISRQDIAIRLRRDGVDVDRLKFTGAHSVVLRPVVRKILPRELLDAAEPVLRAALDLEQQDIEFESVGKLTPLLVPPGRLSLDLDAQLHQGRLHHASANVDVTAMIDGEAVKTVRVPFRLRRYQQVLVTTTAIRKASPVTEQTVTLRRVEASPGTSPFLTDFAALRGKVTARDLQAGRRLTLGMLTDPAAIYSGDIVSLVSVNGRIQVATRAVALRDGAIGARIPVRSLMNDRVVQATVRTRGLVVIQPLTSRPRQQR